MINDRQFVLSKAPFQMEGWRSVKLASGFTLSWEPKLKVTINEARDVCLLGHAWQAVEGMPSPSDIVRNMATHVSEIENGGGVYGFIDGGAFMVRSLFADIRE